MTLIEIIAIGRELLDGRVIDTNAVEIAERLRELGHVPRFAQRVDDDVERIGTAFEAAARRADIVLVTGGLGPTSDDVTAEAFARFIGEPLELKPDALAQVEVWFRRAGRPMIDAQKKQALIPMPCAILPNAEGTAPGFAHEPAIAPEGVDQPRGPGWRLAWYFMPGVPREMRRMLDEQVLPRLPRARGLRSRTWRTQFTSEGELQQRLSDLIARLPPGCELAFRTRFPENHVSLHSSASAPDARIFDTLCGEIERRLGDDVISTSTDGGALPSLEEVVVSRLAAASTAIATTESCTGGLVAHRLTEVPGASRVFFGGIVAYDNAMKETLLGVPRETLARFGAVSAETARAMADGGLARLLEAGAPAGRERSGAVRFGRWLCLSSSGIAGPSGGSDAKPVGSCYVALADSSGPTRVEEIRARPGLDRALYKTLFAQKALDLARRRLGPSA